MNQLETLRSTIKDLADEASRTSLVAGSDGDDDDDDDDTDADEDTDDDEDGDGDADAAEDGDATGDGPSTAAATDAGSQSPEWRVDEADVEETLYGVVRTVGGAFAVGTGGRVVYRTGDGWRVAVRSGPTAKRNTLTCAAASDDGERVWFAGSSGALGMYDVTVGRKYDYSAPMEMTSTWEAIAIAGEHGEETLYVANGSGEVLPAEIDADDCPTFGEPIKPGSGSTIPAVTVGGSIPYAVDTSGNVFARPDDEWTDVGIRNAQIAFTDVHANDAGRVLVAGGGGIVYRYDAACENWTPVDVGSVGLHAIDRAGDEVVVVGDGGHAYRRLPGEGWTGGETPTESALYDVALGPTDVAVGEGGAIVAREGTGRDDEAAGERTTGEPAGGSGNGGGADPEDAPADGQTDGDDPKGER